MGRMNHMGTATALLAMEAENHAKAIMPRTGVKYIRPEFHDINSATIKTQPALTVEVYSENSLEIRNYTQHGEVSVIYMTLAELNSINETAKSLYKEQLKRRIEDRTKTLNETVKEFKSL